MFNTANIQQAKKQFAEHRYCYVDDRRDLRIRYIDPEPDSPEIAVVADISERRQKLLDA